MSNDRQYDLARRMVEKALARMKELEAMTPEQQASYLRGLRDGFKLCAAEMLEK